MSIKITSLIVHVIQSHLETPFSFSQGWVNKRSATLVEINTNDGHYWLGRSILSRIRTTRNFCCSYRKFIKRIDNK